MRAAIPHSQYKTVALVAGLRLRGLTAARTFDGPINAALFEDWVETCLVPTLSPGEIVVMDNLPAHKLRHAHISGLRQIDSVCFFGLAGRVGSVILSVTLR